MIGHDHVRGVLGTALRHVTRNAIGGSGCYARWMSCRMTLQADTGIVPDGLFAARNPMRIVTSGAFQFSAAFQETARLPQTVEGAYRLEFAFVPGAGGVIERDCEVYQWLAGNVREGGTVEALEHRWDAAAGGFEVALHTHLHPSLGSQLCRIHDASAAGGPNMVASGAMASLAIDSLWKCSQVDRLTTRYLIGGRNVGISVMAEHALIGDKSACLRMLGVRPGNHAPFATFVRIPAEWQFN